MFPMRPLAILALTCLATSLVGRAAAEDAWRDDGANAGAWQAQPSWQPNPSPGATVRAVDGVLAFSVLEAGKGMKFSRSVRPFPLSYYRYLVVRYRAENLHREANNYFVYLNDGGPAECHALRLEEIESDGAWHTVAVDAARLASSARVTALAVQVLPAGSAGGRLLVDYLAFTDTVPADAVELRRPVAPSTAPARPDWVMPLAAQGWTDHASWLSNPGDAPAVARRPDGLAFRVRGRQRGMKWSWVLPGAVALRDFRYLTLRYRADGMSQGGDYAVCVIGTADGAGMDYTEAIPPSALETDGQWHTLSLETAEAAAKIPTVREIALQVQAAAGEATLTVGDLRFTNTPSRPPLADFISLQTGWPTPLGKYVPLDLSSLPASPMAGLREHLGIDGWFEADQVTAAGVPFRLRAKGEEASRTGMLAEGRLAVPVGRKVSEVYLLLTSLFAGDDDPARGGGPLKALEDVDRFRIRLEYAGGAVAECLPLDVAARRRRVAAGPRVLCAFADPKQVLARVVVDDRSRQAVFALLGATVHAGAPGPLDAFRMRPAPTPQTPAGKALPAGAPSVTITPGRIRLANGALQAVFATAGGLRLTSLIHHGGPNEVLPAGGGPLLQAVAAGKTLPADALAVESAREVSVAGAKAAEVVLSGRGAAAGLRVRLRLSVRAAAEIAIEGEMENAGSAPLVVSLRGPAVPGIRLGAAADNFHVFPQSGAVWGSAPVSLEKPFSGEFPLQFVDVYNRRTGGGVLLRTEDQVGVDRSYTLDRGEDGLTRLGTAYPERTLAPGARRPLVRTLIGVHQGDWRAAMDVYRRWLRTWHKPAAPRQRWFREVFNFRQRFLWGYDPLYEPASGRLDLQSALDEARAEFGGIEYLHLFDWGSCGPYGRIYGRTGDYSPWEYLKGGVDAFRSAIAGVQAQGVPVGLYIEGYLLEERGKLGQARGKEWQRIGADGKGQYWPRSTEMFVCPWIPEWRQVQASTYERTVKETGASGMYIDEFGFCHPGWASCYSDKHGHPVPGTPTPGEQGLTRRVREGVDHAKPGVALYTEECPPDVNNRLQDGSFTYSMARALHAPSAVPLNLLRFAIPDFKTFEILVCDKPMASWVTGVHWVFFNGEGIWLEGPAQEWFEPATRAAIRKCHALLREHRDAFAGDTPEALVPTLLDGVFANAFNAPGKRVLVLYNSHLETVRGEVLRLPHRPGRRYEDAWNGRALRPRIAGGYAYLDLALGPQEPGCVVVR